MLAMMLALEDTTIKSEKLDQKWKVEICNVLALTKATCFWTDNQYATVLKAVISGEYDETEKLILNPIFNELPAELRIIP